MSTKFHLAHYPLDTESLPLGWALCSVREICGEPQPGFASGRHNQDGRGVLHLRPMNIDSDGRIVLENSKYVAGDDARRVLARDVLFNNTNSPAWVGKCAPILAPGDWAFSNHMTRLRPAAGVDPRFLAGQLHYLQTTGYFRHLCVNHVNQASISSDALADNVPVLLPPEAEQVRIADRIDELFTDLSAGVAALERVKRNLARYRAAVLHAAVTGKLTEAWRKEHGPADEPGPQLLQRILAERRRQWEQRTLAKYEKAGKKPPKNWKSRYPEPAKPRPLPDGSPLLELPKDWCWTSVDQIAHIIQYGTSAKTNDDSTGVRVLRMGNITTRGTIDYKSLKYLPHDHHEFPELLLQPGDVLFNRTNSAELVGKSAVFDPTIDGPFSFASYLIRVRAVSGCSPWWLTWCLISPLGRHWLRSVLSHTAGQANVNGTKLAEYVIPLPPLAEQAAIIEAVNEKLSQIDALEAEVERGLRRAGRLRQAILKAAFEGKLVPQDPSDEPASVLLERIRKEAAENGHSTKRRQSHKASRKTMKV
jgi:type I restriction enzyme S subunit